MSIRIEWTDIPPMPKEGPLERIKHGTKFLLVGPMLYPIPLDAMCHSLRMSDDKESPSYKVKVPEGTVRYRGEVVKVHQK